MSLNNKRKLEIEDIIKLVKVGTRCDMGNKIYEVVGIKPYSEECDSPLYKLMVVDNKSIEELKQELERNIKRNRRTESFFEEDLIQYKTISDIEPMWFIERGAILL